MHSADRPAASPLLLWRRARQRLGRSIGITLRFLATLHGLHRLTDRDLRDLGIKRSDIIRLAWDAARRQADAAATG
jgi:hypothetical protein